MTGLCGNGPDGGKEIERSGPDVIIPLLQNWMISTIKKTIGRLAYLVLEHSRGTAGTLKGMSGR